MLTLIKKRAPQIDARLFLYRVTDLHYGSFQYLGPLGYGLEVIVFTHLGIFPIDIDLTGKILAGSTGVETLFIDRTVIDRAQLNSEVFHIERLALDLMAISSTLFFERTWLIAQLRNAFTADTTWC